MIKLTQLIKELGINAPKLVTVKQAYDYLMQNIVYNYNEFSGQSEGWKEYVQLIKPYNEKYNIKSKGLYLYRKLSKSELNTLYNNMRKLVQKYVGNEIL